MSQIQVKQDALAARAAGLALPEGGWAAAARKSAEERLAAMGLPAKRDEYWRYTNPTALTQAAAPAAKAAGEEAALFGENDRLKLVFTDGVFNAEASDDLALSGVALSLLGDEASAWAADLYGALETAGQSPVERPLATLNTLYAIQGVVIHVTGQAAKPVELVYENKSAGSDVFLHHVVKLEEGAELTLLESGVAGSRYNTVMEVLVADRASFHHIRGQGRDADRLAVTHIFTRLGAESLFKSFTLGAKGSLTRNEAIIELLGDDASAHVAGASVGDGPALQDDTVFITHGARNCESRQVYKKVLSNGATGVFQGKILVKQIAQKTDGYQISQALLLDGESQFLAKPELEIYADDVKCSHGSTSGAIDETALFYLQSRGVPKAIAQSLMVLAFLAEAIQEIENEDLAEAIRARLEIWLGDIQG